MSIPARADRRPNGLQSGAKVGGMSGQAEPEVRAPRYTYAPESSSRFSLNNGMHFPLAGPTGKLDPQSSVIPGRAFPIGFKAENASRSEAKFRDAVSAGALGKRKGPLCRGPSQFKVAGKGIAPALRACGPLRRFAPCELRWQTLTRLLSSAPSRGSIPRRGHIKEKDPFAEVLVNSRWRGRESRPRSARADRCGASRLASCAGKRSRVYSAPRPHGVRFRVGAI